MAVNKKEENGLSDFMGGVSSFIKTFYSDETMVRGKSTQDSEAIERGVRSVFQEIASREQLSTLQNFQTMGKLLETVCKELQGVYQKYRVTFSQGSTKYTPEIYESCSPITLAFTDGTYLVWPEVKKDVLHLRYSLVPVNSELAQEYR